MIVCHRLISSSAFLFAAILLTAASARGQRAPGPGQHESLPGSITPDQIKRALDGRGGGMPDLPPELLEMLKDRVERQAKQKVDDRDLKQAVDRMRTDPNFRKQVEEMGRRMKNGGGGGKNAITPEERRQLEKLIPEIQKGLPQNNGQPPINPGPMNLDPPPMPRDPVFPPPPMPPKLPPQPQDKGNALKNLDPDGKNPFDQPQTPKEKAAQAAASMWERNVGPLDDTPSVKRAIFELIDGTEDLRDSDGKSFWDDISKETGDSTSLFDILNGTAPPNASWDFPKLDLGDWKLFGDSGPEKGGGDSAPRESWWSRTFGGGNRPPAAPNASSPSGWNFGVPGLQGGWLPVVILAAILVGGLLLWKFWGAKWSRNRAAVGLYGPGWPLDPRRITTREHVVIAFEYLSVLICGPSAKTWTHNTIASALADLATTHGEVAVMLARLYELARYAPLDEPLTTKELAEARRLVCALAGLEHE